MVQKHLEAEIQKAVEVLKEGGVVVFPTETAYGLAADARSEAAVERVRAVKGRSQDKSFPLIAASREMVERFAGMPRGLETLATQHWSGPLTLVLPVMGDGLASGVVRNGTVAMRVSSHPVAHALCEGLGAPIVATSANLAGGEACYSVACVRQQLGDAPDFYLDAGELTPEPPSTIVAIDDYGYPEVLRQGSIEI
ncbi:threonylcarbamoyl-AMP synthase [Candidatus Uhrbacteria bacterium]|nr:threonylcarbamoyl-AMP synthase [Candidatus Uhrbacteria bacterium]